MKLAINQTNKTIKTLSSLLVLMIFISGCSGGDDEFVNNNENNGNNQGNNGETNNPASLVATVGKPYTRQIQGATGSYFSLNNPPRGMTINPRTGKIYWTPTPDQSGDETITVSIASDTSERTESFDLKVDATTDFPELSHAIFFSPDGLDDKDNIGTSYEEPNLNTKWFCKKQQDYPQITTFYYRGGIYHNPNFGNSLENRSIPKIACSGTKDSPITIKPWGNEKVKIKFDGNYGLQLHGDYLHLENFEIEGMAQEISYEDAVAHWWSNENYYNGSGLQYFGTGIQIKNNIIHDVPGAGINNKGNKIVDDLLIEGNIIFNASWWNTGGTTALGVVGADENPDIPQSDAGANIQIKNNLIFSNESRIFSHVFKKGFSHLTIDEGSATLLKRDKNGAGTYDKGFLLENNFYLFNGKGVSIRWNNITFKNNTFYNNGTTIAGGAGAFRSNGGTNLVLQNNAAFAGIEGTNAIDFSDTVTLDDCSNNLFWETLSNEQDCETGQNGNILTADIFEDPENNDFTTQGDYGASTVVFDTHQKKLEELGFEIKPANFTLQIDGEYYPVNSPEYYQKQIDDIVDNIPDGGSYQLVDEDGKGGENDYEISFPDENNPTENTIFYLKVD